MSETLLITLSACAEASERLPGLGFSDPWAAERLERLDLDRSLYNGSGLLMKQIAIRAHAVDAIARRFFSRHPGALGIEPGAGLSARFERIDNGQLRWVDLDLPAVTELKRKLVEPGDRHALRAGSVLDPAWIEELVAGASGPVLVVMEGLLPYLERDEVRGVLVALGQTLPAGSEVVFDYAHPWVVRRTRLLPQVYRTGARFSWGSSRITEVERWCPRLQLLEELDLVGPVAPGASLVSRALRRLTGGWVYGLARFGINPSSSPRKA